MAVDQARQKTQVPKDLYAAQNMECAQLSLNSGLIFDVVSIFEETPEVIDALLEDPDFEINYPGVFSLLEYLILLVHPKKIPAHLHEAYYLDLEAALPDSTKEILEAGLKTAGYTVTKPFAEEPPIIDKCRASFRAGAAAQEPNEGPNQAIVEAVAAYLTTAKTPELASAYRRVARQCRSDAHLLDRTEQFFTRVEVELHLCKLLVEAGIIPPSS